MILLSSAKAARGSSGGSAPPVWGVDMGGSRSRGRTAGRASRQSWKRRRRPLTSEEPGREPADALLHPPGAGRRKRRQLAACGGPTDPGRRYSPIACPGRTSTAATAPTAASARRPEPGGYLKLPRRLCSGGAVEDLGRAEARQALPPADSVPGRRPAPTGLDAGTTAKELRCPHPPPSPAGSPSWLGGWRT